MPRRTPSWFLYCIAMGVAASYLQALTYMELRAIQDTELSKYDEETPTCSCFNSPTQGENCCDRRILVTHKMGTVFCRRTFKKWVLKGYLSLQASIKPNVVYEGKKDYRHVVVTRPLYESMVSGYLYHKSGNECWKSASGVLRAANHTSSPATRHWFKKLTHPLKPRSRDRNLCQYLVDESEEDGMRAFVDFSIGHWYGGIMQYLERVKRQGDSKTLFICYQDLVSSDTSNRTLHRIVDFMFPAGADVIKVAPARMVQGHKTSEDSVQRQRLHALAERFDKQLFDGLAGRITAALGCS